ncbi:GNAT family N-acetyltransferase [Anaeromyxobacter oryzae]|uniref:Glycosyl transferase n=1 Tax=Anaeromyxobacter oryzae TaxID=2918170 RepID=A0ABM7X2K9_9BACT|nr:GNAT family N-acetyltransferase [Anaeromyxobacter oryzae]BDG06020.1 glycosyl transferase [Anaeromyxobacter oryzae]
MSGAPAATALAVHQSHDPARLEALAPEWSALVDAAGVPSPFLAPEWLLPWWRRFGGRRALWILEARDGAGRLEGLLLLASRPALPGVRRWQLLGNGITGADGLDLLARAGAGSAARAAIAGALAAGGWDLLDLEDLPFGSPTAAVLRQVLAPGGVDVEARRRFACPGFAVRGTFEAHVRRMRRRETYGRRVRWLAKQPGFRIEVAAAPDEAGPALEDFLRLHRLRWAAEGGSYGIPPGSVEDFHRDAVPRLAARGWLRLYRLLVGDRSIAAVYGVEAGGTFHYYQSGYDPEWSVRSPGMVLVGRTIEDAYARGLRYYDFLRGEEPYKLDWSADRRELCAVRVRAPSFRASAAVAADGAWRAARGAARALAPERAWAALQRARRGLEAGAAAPAAAEGRA